jgi:CxxC motif-containing protein (DUF1111 family)
MRIIILHLTMLVALTAVILCIPSGKLSAEAEESGVAVDHASFSQPMAGLSTAQREQFLHGAALFRQSWSAVGEGDADFAGLGPTYDAVACAACHVRAGRGRPPLRQGETLSSLVIRLSVAGQDGHGGPRPHPAYGGQLGGRAIAGVVPESRIFVEYTGRTGRYGDSSPYQLRHPVYVFYRLAFGALGDGAMTSPRLAPAVPGARLLEAIPEADILARADPEDGDGDGISGRPNIVWDPVAGAERLGRFGWKAGEAGLLQQTAGAAFGDMGLTSSLYPEQSCPPPQQACRTAAVAASAPELSDKRLAALTVYLRYLAPPPRRGAQDPAVLHGENLFEIAGCAACHTPSARTGPPLAGHDIAPYSDLLLHDMGAGLADGRPDFKAIGREWRTPPLWGLGSLIAVNGHEFLLHDGRARGIAEANIWHGGEAERAKETFRKMSAATRADLLAFLRSL